MDEYDDATEVLREHPDYARGFAHGAGNGAAGWWCDNMSAVRKWSVPYRMGYVDGYLSEAT